MTAARNRRRRVQRPTGILIAGIFFILLPFVNFALAADGYGLSVLQPVNVLQRMNWPAIILLMLPLVIAYGLLSVRLWGWYLAIIYTAIVAAYVIYHVAVENGLRIAPLLELALLIPITLFLIRMNIAAPYFSTNFRGWRLQAREPVEVPVKVNGQDLHSTDLSPGGLSIAIQNPAFQPNEMVPVKIKLNDNWLALESGVARIEAGNVGLAFRNLETEQRNAIKSFLQQIEARS